MATVTSWNFGRAHAVSGGRYDTDGRGQSLHSTAPARYLRGTGRGAQFDIGGEIIMGVEDVAAVVGLSTGTVVANHLESLDHCPTTREQLSTLLEQPGIGNRLLIPDDGQELTWNRQPSSKSPGVIETD